MYTAKVKFREKYADSHGVLPFKYLKKCYSRENFVYPKLKSP